MQRQAGLVAFQFVVKLPGQVLPPRAGRKFNGLLDITPGVVKAACLSEGRGQGVEDDGM
jgi:hypothetical protein